MRILYFKTTTNGIDDSKIRVEYEDGDFFVMTYIDNIFGFKKECFSNEYINQEVEVEYISRYYQERYNNGRGNSKKYDTLLDYFNDPLVKKRCLDWYNNKVDFNFAMPDKDSENTGQPDEVDVTMQLRYNGIGFTLSGEYLHDRISLVPLEWYAESIPDVCNELVLQDWYDTFEECLGNIQTSECFIFGDRYFPVAKLPNNISELGYEICQNNSKNCSLPVIVGDDCYIGMRCSPYGIDKVISEIYDNGWFILKDKEWDW